MALENVGGAGVEFMVDCDAVERFVTCMVSVITPPTPVEVGVAVKDASIDLRVHVGSAPESEKPPCVETDAPESESPVTSAAAASGSAVMLNSRLAPGDIRLEVEPLEHAPLPCSRASVMDPVLTDLTHQPAGGEVEELISYLAVSTVKVISLMFFEALLLVTVSGSTASGSPMVTSVPDGTVTVKVSAPNEVDAYARASNKNTIVLRTKDLFISCL
jgi:hypothetical protein